MLIDLKTPFRVNVDKFKIDYKKDEVNPYMTKKILKKKYESLGYKTMQGDDFETNLLLVFVRKTRFMDKYIKVKLGEYKYNTKAEEYNQELLDIFDFETVQKLLFICRVCSYIGDPGFPDLIVYNKQETALRYVYAGDEILANKIVFILLSKIFGLEIKFSAVDFSDYQSPEFIEIDTLKSLESAMQSMEKRVNLEKPEDVGIDLNFFKKWINSKSIDAEDLLGSYNNFVKLANSQGKLKELVSKLETLNSSQILGSKEKPERLKALRDNLGVNMMEAIDVLNLWEIMHQRPF
ncbi:MAG TPA: hypothetical protein VJA47_06790 [archaeon]|nr:hypothetical protein [archaeon]